MDRGRLVLQSALVADSAANISYGKFVGQLCSLRQERPNVFEL